ncbi:chorismate mutase [Sphingomonas crocodyli]|uniref:chorismate mutase n=1 Tax=Sphingomonas crocodyli TaxID=1979270 RepID=A0A437LWT6_9SPHN|nr:chorismate mutase [Sphingomonas crocodyli]RVT89868.1 chorismate mutase [Sphingomonas crocodyli]
MTEETPAKPEIVPAADCTQMSEVRAAIDSLDTLIVSLLGERMRYIEAAARIKPDRGAVRDEVRKAAVIAHAVKVADDRGFPPKLAYQLYDMLVEGSIAHEFAVYDATREG